MFERFTQGARSAVTGAQIRARELGHRVIGTEHVLLALVEEEGGTVAAILCGLGVDGEAVRSAIVRHVGERTGEPGPDRDAEDAAALKAIGIDLDAVRAAIEENFGAGALRLPRPAPKKRGLFGRFHHSHADAPRPRGHIPFSPRAKKTLELSLREAIRLKHNFIAPEHILLGIIRDAGGLGMLILTERGLDIEKLRDDLTRALRTKAA